MAGDRAEHAEQAEHYRAHEHHLQALCYRLTGSTADAADLVQETFTRFLERGPADRDRDVRPWLVRVAVNLARDRYRQRRRRAYVGLWLPAPIDTDAAPWMIDDADLEATYAARESVQLAFLVALEALGPNERAVLVLREVLDYSAREAADALSLSEVNVRTLHARARRKMSAYDATRTERAGDDVQREALGQLMMALASGDADQLAAVLAADVRTRTDGAGVVRAALREIAGAPKVARFYLGLMRKVGGGEMSAELRHVNGQPALVLTLADARPRWASRMVFTVDADRAGRVRRIWVLMAPDKLAGLRT